MLEPEMDAFVRRLVPGIEHSWKGASAEDIEDLEDQVDLELPRFYRWFLSTMGADAGPLNHLMEHFFARTILAGYRMGDFDHRSPLLMIARFYDPMMSTHYYYDLSRPVRNDAFVIRGRPRDGVVMAETLREYLGSFILELTRVDPASQRCGGVFRYAGTLKPVLDEILVDLGFQCPLETGLYCGVYERSDMAMTCSVQVKPGTLGLLVFRIGGSNSAAIRSVLGTITTEADIEISGSSGIHPSLPPNSMITATRAAPPRAVHQTSWSDTAPVAPAHTHAPKTAQRGSRTTPRSPPRRPPSRPTESPRSPAQARRPRAG